MRTQHLMTYPECRVCEDDREVVVHHLRYRGQRGVSEQPGDLITLCTVHHDALHRIVGPGNAFVADAVRKSLEWISMERFNVADDRYRDAMDS